MLKFTFYFDEMEDISKEEFDDKFRVFGDAIGDISYAYTNGSLDPEALYRIETVSLSWAGSELFITANGSMDDVELYDDMLADIERTLVQHYPSIEQVQEVTVEPYVKEKK